jgi:hypothetical protein
MAVGTAMLVAAGIGAATKAIGAAKASSAAKKAAKQQSEGAEQAAGVHRQVYGTQMGLMEPYAALGRQSANTLGRLMQPGVPYTPGMQQFDARAMQNTPPPWMQQQPPGPGTAVPRGTLGGMMPGMLPGFASPPPRTMGRLMPMQPIVGARPGMANRLGNLYPRAA